jgi:hypothetical protein
MTVFSKDTGVFTETYDKNFVNFVVNGSKFVEARLAVDSNRQTVKSKAGT